MAYPIAIVMNFMATVILGMQTFDMGLITDNCGDVEVCVPHVKPIALGGWILFSASLIFLVSNVMIMFTYWQLNNRVLEEEQYGFYHENHLHLHSHSSNSNSNIQRHQFSHQHYPSNYSKSLSSESDPEKGQYSSPKIKTPQPKRLAKDIFTTESNDYVFFSKADASKLSSGLNEDGLPSASSSVSDYKSLQISPLESKTGHNQIY